MGYNICFSSPDFVLRVIIRLNWSTVKMSILIGSLSGPNFAIRTTKMELSRTDFVAFCFRKDICKEPFWRLSDQKYWENFSENGPIKTMFSSL